MSSVFGDYRDFHFHAGIDITTGGKTGAKITAPTDGTVFRVFTSYQGYGKAVYLKAEDGKIFVFGHLSDFSPKLSGLVESEQLKNRRYYIDLLTSGIKIRKGEVIGYSGESGYGGPHLHFEMRDGGNHPMNPLVFGFVVPDAIPPIIEKVAIKPVDLSSTVNGLHSWAIMPFSYDEKQKVYTLPDTLVVDGEFGIALSAFDRMNGLRRRFGIYQMKVLLDGELAFFSSYDSLDFDKTYKIDLERKYLSKINKKEEFYELFLEPGNDLNLYLQNKGTINTQAVDSLGKKIYQRGYHQVEILVFDASHNFSLARFYLLFDQSPKLKQVSSEPFENNTKVKVEVLNKYEVSKVHLQTTRLDSIFWGDTIISQQDSQDIYSFILSREPQMVRVRCEDRFGNFSDYKYMLINQDKLSKPPDGYTPSSVRMDYAFDKGNFIFYLFFDKLVLEQPDVWLEAFGLDFNSTFCHRSNDTTFYVVIPFKIVNRGLAKLTVKGNDISKKEFQFDFPIPIAITTPSAGGEARSWDGVATVVVDTGEVYEDANLTIQKSYDIEKEMVRGTFYAVEPQDASLNKEATIWLKYPEGMPKPEKLAIYVYNTREDKWGFTGKERDQDQRTIKAKIKCFSTYALGQDTIPPSIRIIRPKEKQKLKVKRPEIVIKIKDDFSGIEDDRDIEAYLDGEWLIPEYDIDNNILRTKPHFDLGYGEHTLTVQVKDRMGNTSSAKSRFEVISQ